MVKKLFFTTKALCLIACAILLHSPMKAIVRTKRGALSTYPLWVNC